MEPLSPQNSELPPLSHPETSDSTHFDKEASDMDCNEKAPPDTSHHGNTQRQDRDQNDEIASVRTAPKRVGIMGIKRVGLRITVAFVALVPLSLLVIAGNLNPAEEGLGTHQDLGLPPCSLRVLAGIRCPACGMTTSWSYFARGNWLASMNTNAGGFLLALLSLLMIVLAAQVIHCGRLPSPRVQTWVTMAGAGVLIVTLVDWIIRLQS